MKTAILGASLLFASLANAVCVYSYQKEQTKLTWTAFKTPKKVGVQGSFTSYEVKATAQKSVEDVLKNATFKIDASTVSTGNPDRDKKIANFFFSTLKGGATIQGKVTKVKSGKATVALTINEKTMETVFDVVTKDELVTLTSSIDVLNFGMNDQLAALHEACKMLHEGKTWSEVNLSLETTLAKKCE